MCQQVYEKKLIRILCGHHYQIVLLRTQTTFRHVIPRYKGVVTTVLSFRTQFTVSNVLRQGQLPSWRSWLARQSHNLKVVSSSLTEGIYF